MTGCSILLSLTLYTTSAKNNDMEYSNRYRPLASMSLNQCPHSQRLGSPLYNHIQDTHVASSSPGYKIKQHHMQFKKKTQDCIRNSKQFLLRKFSYNTF